MKYEFKTQAIKQLELDAFIKDNSDIKSEQQYWEDRIVALLVELGELANEIRFFKYWSKKPASDKEIIIDEFVDCLHFAFSLGNTLGNDQWTFSPDDMKRPINIVYFELIGKLNELVHNQDVVLFRSMLFNLVEIAWNLSYSMDDIKEAYNKKNAVNYERQNTGY